VLKLRAGVRGLALALLLAGAPAQAEERTIELANGEQLRYRVVTAPAESAHPAALALLGHLAAGEIETAAALSNAPQRRLEVLRNFRDSVGDDEFKRLFSRYFVPANRLVLEAAIERHRLLVWELGEAGRQLTGQYFVEVDGRFLLDDVPSATRTRLQRLLAALKKGDVP
jgi:hypothetical protein